MPLRECIVDGKKGWQYGSQKCFTGPNAKKQVLNQMIAIYGPDKFQKHLHGEGALAEFGGYENLTLAKAMFQEMFPRGRADVILHGVASYFQSKADDGQNSSDTDRGNVLDEVNNAGPDANQYKNTGDGTGLDSSVDPKVPKKEHFVKECSMGAMVEYIGAAIIDLQKKTTNQSVNDDAHLEKPRDNPATNIVTSPYNKDASPETDPEKTPKDGVRYEPPTRSDMEPAYTKTIPSDPTIQYDTKGDSSRGDMYMQSPRGGNLKMNMADNNDGDEDESVAYISQKERDEMPSSDFADPPDGFPIKDKKHYEAALRLVGRKPESEQSRIRENILRIGKRKGFA